MSKRVLFCIATGLGLFFWGVFFASCNRSCVDDIDTSLAGMIVSRGSYCRCSLDGKELLTPSNVSFDVSKHNDEMIIIDVYGKGIIESSLFPSGSTRKGWHIGTSPFNVQGNNMEVSFNEPINLTLQSYFEDNSEKSNLIEAEIHGWISNSSVPVTRSSNEVALSFNITINWTQSGESHVIKLIDVRSDLL